MILPGALQTLDLMVAAAVEEMPRAEPPASPAIGATYIVAGAASGDWVGRDQCLAGYTEGGWRFVQPRPGTTAYVISASLWAVYRDGVWETGCVRGQGLFVGDQQVVGSRAAAIATPAAGAVIDAEARAAVGQILSVLRGHGLIAT